MQKYGKRDIRAADFLALFLVAVGVVLLVIGVPSLVFWLLDSGSVTQDVATSKGKASVVWRAPGLRPALLGAMFFLLGLALNVKLKRLVANAGRENTEYDGVPD